MHWTVRLEARTSAGEVTTTELATVSRPAMVSTLRANDDETSSPREFSLEGAEG